MSKPVNTLRRTRSNRILAAALMACPAVLATLAMTQSAPAATLYWDVNGPSPDGASTTTAAGTWDSTTSNWSTDPSGSSVTGLWSSASTADFSAGTNVTGNFTVTVSGTQNTTGVTFEEGGTVTLSGGTLSLTGATPTFFNAAGGTNGSPKSIVINSALSGTAGATFDLLGAGVTNYTIGGNNSGLTGKILIGQGTVLTSGVPSDYVNLIPTTNTALGASGAANLIDFTIPTTASVVNFSRVTLNGGRSINKDINIRGGADPTNSYGNINNIGNNTWAGNINIEAGSSASNGTGAAISSQSGTLDITGTIQNGTGTGLDHSNWSKIGPGTVILDHANTFTDFMRFLNGVLEVRVNGALGTAGTPQEVTGNVVMTPNEAGPVRPILAFAAPPSAPGGFNYSTFEMIDVAGARVANGTIVDGTGVDNYTGANTFAGDIRFGQLGAVNTGVGQLLGAEAGSSLELSGHIWAAQANTARIVTKTGGGELIISGSNTTADDTAGGPASGHGRGCFSLNMGTFNIAAGTLTIRGGGTLNGGIAIQMSPGTTLKLDNTLQVIPDRVPNTGVYSMNAANLQLLGNATASASQTLASLSFDGSMSTVTVSQPTTANASTTTIALTGSLGRTAANRGTGLILGIDNANGILTTAGGLTGMSPLGGGGAAGSKTISILPPLAGDSSPTGGGSDFVTLDGTHVRTLASNEYQELSADDGLQTQDNAKVSATTSIASTADTQVNALKLNNGTSLTIGAGHRLTVKSGAVLAAGTSTSTLTGGNLAFEQYYPAGVQSPTDMNDLTVGAYATDPSNWSPGNPAQGISDGAVPNSANEGVITVPSAGLLIQDPTNVISGTAGLTKSGAGTLRLQGNNTFGGSKHYFYYDGGGVDEEFATSAASAGPLTINAGRLEFYSDANLGYSLSSIVINGGTLAPLQTTTSTRPINVGSLGNSIIDVASAVTFTTSGQVSGTVLNKNGAGILALTNTANNYTGGTMINAGYVELLTTSPTQAELGAGAVTLNGGSLRADDNLVLDRSVVSTSGNTTGGFYIAAGKTLTYGSGSSSTSGISGSGNIAIDGGGTLLLAKVAGAQMTYTGSLIVNNASTLEFADNGAGNTQAGLGGTPNTSATWVILNNNSRLKFDVASSGGSDFSGGTRGITVNSTGGIIDIAASNTVINTAGIFGTGTVTKDDTGLYSLRVANNSFSGKWNVLQGTLEFGAPTNNALSLGTGSGADFITIQNGATLRQTTTATTGTMGANQGITLAGATANIDIAAGTTLTVPSDITAGSGKTLNKIGTGNLNIKNYRGDTLNVTAGNVKIIAGGTSASTSKMNTLAVAASSTLDLTNNKLVLSSMPAGNSAFPYTDVTAMVKTGQGVITGGAPTWNGTGGISTSDAGAVNSIAKTLAVAAASDVKNITGAQTALFGGQTVSATDTLVMYTWGGDADLSGKIDADDYFRIDSNYNKSGTKFGYSSGDFNYDGAINGDDYFIIDSNYLASQANPISPGSIVDGSGGAAISGVAAVPEPAGLSMLAIGIGLASRRRRRS